MSDWQIGGIDFSDYGVYISRSQGVLDIPSIQNTGHDWLDEHGKDYHADALKLADREIVLTCWLYSEAVAPASAYQTFVAKVSAFFGAMLSPGYKTLRTPYGDIDNTYLKDQVPVLRESNYVTDQQIGTFTMRLTVPGDVKYNVHTIYLPAGTTSGQYLLTNNLQINRTLQGDSYATCSMETNTPLTVEMYAYILVNTNGVVAEPYYFMARPEVNKLSTNKYTYNLRLEHGSVLLKQSQFLFDGISDFEIFADLNTIVDLVITNATRFIPGKFVKGTIETTGSAAIKKNHTFKGEDCYSVVKRMSQEYGLEYDIRFSAGAIYTIDIKSKIATTKAVTLEYGRGNGLYELTREAPNRDQLVTVLYAYGSTKNIKPDYRSGKPRLEFTGNPLRQNDTLYMGVEKTVFFDDIYPQRTAPITGYTQILKCEEADPGWAAYAAIKEIWPGGMYRVEDNTVFDLNAYLLDDGRKAKIRFKTGAMAGYEFEIEKYDHVPGHIFIIPFKDQNGYMMPNETLYPAAPDQYTLVDIDQPTSYVSIAEAELLSTAQEYLDKYSVPEYSYRCRVDPAFLSGIIARFEVGDRITVVDSDMSINALYRISQLIHNEYTGIYDLLLSEHRILNRRERQQIVIDRVERTIQATNADTVETIRKEKETANEIRNRIFTPADDLQNVDHTVRDESIDPRMMAFDAGIPQFQVKGCIGETPWLDDFNKVHLTSGYIEVLNWPDSTLNRYAIYALERDGGHYDPRRTWTMPDTVITLPDGDLYYLIAKLPLDETITVGEWVASDTYIRPKSTAGHVWYTAGVINMVESPRVLAMLWGNVRISAGQISASIDPRLLTSGQMIYLHTEDSDLTGYKQALTTQPEDAMATYTAAANFATGDVLIEEFSTDAGYPGVTVIPAGPWIFNYWVAVGSGTQSLLVVKVYKRDVAGVETELLSFTQSVTDPVGVEQFKAVPMAQVELLATDRLVVKYYHRNAGATLSTMYLFAEGNTEAEWKWSGYRIPLAPVGGGDFVEDVYVEHDPQYPIDHLYYTKKGLPVFITNLMQLNGLIWGGGVTPIDGLVFGVGAAIYGFNGDLFQSNSTTVECDAADNTYSRIDIIVVDINETVSIIKGIPAENPQKPTVDPETQIELTQILIPANATEPANIHSGLIYDENTEWTGSGTGVTIDFNNATAPFHGSKCASVKTVNNNDVIAFADALDEDLTDYTNLILNIKLKATMTSQHNLYVSWLNNGVAVSNEIVVPLNKTNITNWQTISIALTAWVYTGSTVDVLKFRWSKTGTNTNHNGFYLDFIKLEGGMIQPIVSGSVVLIGDVSGSGTTGTPIPTTLATVNTDVGTFGDSTHVAQVTVDAKGRVTAVEEVEIEASGSDNNVQVIGFDYNDIEPSEARTIYLSDYMENDFEIIAVQLTSDDTMDDLEIQIDGTPVEFTGGTAVDVTTTPTRTEAIDDNTGATGSVITMEISGTDGGDVTFIRGHLAYKIIVIPTP